MNPPASPFLDPDHWSYRVLRRLDHAGVLPRGADVARQSIPQEEIAAWLQIADSLRGTRYAHRFRSEFKPTRPDTVTVLERSLQVGFGWTKDLVAPGVGYDSAHWQGSRLLPDESEYLYGLRFAIGFAPHLAAAGDFTGELDEWRWQANATTGYLGAWVGRRELGWGVGDAGGLVLNRHELLGGGLYLTKPWRVPVLGATRFEMHLARIDNIINFQNVQRPTEPWFWTARGSIAPFERLRIGINRGMMFGGAGNLPVTFSRVAKNLIGIYTDEQENSFANQVMSIDFRWRTPLSITAYLDWGSDDAAGAFADVPGILGGLEWVHVDSTFDVALGAEYLQFNRACCGNSIWYRNAWFRGSWANGDQLLGHPLGGHGREWRVFGHGSAGSGALSLQGAVYGRRRRAENILVPLQQGKSMGVSGGVDVGFRTRTRIRLHGEAEWGSNDWTASRLLVSVRNYF